MSIKTKAKKLAILIANPEILFSKKKYLFVVSHMRSRSSVLSHILGNNPEVIGYKELHQAYTGKKSLINMQIELAKDLKPNFKNKYLLDKILNNYTISDAILKKVQPKMLFLLRDPEETIKSILNMGFKTGVAQYKDPIKVTEYYCKRLRNLEQLSYKAGKGNLFIVSKDLVENSEDTLNKISKWLHLEAPLKTTYTTFKDTGVIGFGDPLENIKSGVLQATTGYANVDIPEHLLKKANDSYEKCKATLIKNVK
jgi:hypothetical protein